MSGEAWARSAWDEQTTRQPSPWQVWRCRGRQWRPVELVATAGSMADACGAARSLRARPLQVMALQPGVPVALRIARDGTETGPQAATDPSSAGPPPAVVQLLEDVARVRCAEGCTPSDLGLSRARVQRAVQALAAGEIVHRRRRYPVQPAALGCDLERQGKRLVITGTGSPRVWPAAMVRVLDLVCRAHLLRGHAPSLVELEPELVTRRDLDGLRKAGLVERSRGWRAVRLTEQGYAAVPREIAVQVRALVAQERP